MFEPPPKYNQERKCSKCGTKTSVNDSYCSKCGKQLMLLDKDIKNKIFSEKDIQDLYNYFYNSGDKLITKNCSEVIDIYIKRLYGSFPVHATLVINSSIRSGYSYRKSEELIFVKKKTKEKLDWKIINKYVSELDIKLESENEDINKITLLSLYLFPNKNYIKYSSEDFINTYLNNAITDNINYLLPILSQIYSGKEYMSIGGFPHYYENEIVFDEELKNSWAENIAMDTMYGYCLKLAEFLLS